MQPKSKTLLLLFVFLCTYALFNIAPFFGSPAFIPFISSPEKIRIGLTACVGSNARRNPSITETVTLIKSALISASIWNVERELEFYIFVDNLDAKGVILEQVNRYRTELADKIGIQLFFLNATENIPKDILNRNLGVISCQYTRLFFPDSLPQQIKTILYLDTDVLILGNIQKIFDVFTNDTGKDKMAAMVPFNEPEDTKYYIIFLDHFAMIPHVNPIAVNSGIMFMNLEKMRAQNWTERALDVYHEFKPNGNYLNDQQVINIIFNQTPTALKQFPCQYNFEHLHCDQGWNCQAAVEDPDGVQILHGAGAKFEGESSHSKLFEAYKDFDLRYHQDIVELLLKPLKQFYRNKKHHSLSCHGLLGDQLFKSVIL